MELFSASEVGFLRRPHYLLMITVKESMALCVEVRFIDESDFVNKRKSFIVKDNPDRGDRFLDSFDFAD